MTLFRGSSGEVVRLWQLFLSHLGYQGKRGPLLADGDFGTETEHATRTFQADHGLTTGIVDDRTRMFAVKLGFQWPGDAEDTYRISTLPPSSNPGTFGEWTKESKPILVVNAEPVFGPFFSRIVKSGCQMAGTDPRWLFELFAYESGFDPLRENDHQARGLWQRLAERDREGRLLPYKVKDPAKQVADFFMRVTILMRDFSITRFPTRGHWYCLNLAPARLHDDMATLETVVYDWRRDGEKYAANHQLARVLSLPEPGCYVGKDGKPRRPFFTLAELEAPLLNAGRIYRPRIERELAALTDLG